MFGNIGVELILVLATSGGLLLIGILQALDRYRKSKFKIRGSDRREKPSSDIRGGVAT